jgi:hypothetical protein
MPDDDDEPRGLNPAQREVEGALRSLAPASARVDPVAAAFDAGRRSTARQVQLWQSATVVLLLVGAGSWFIPAGRRGAGLPTPEVPGSVAVIPAHLPAAQAAPVQPLPDESLLMLQQLVRDKGVDGLPAPRLPAVRPVRADELF